MWGHRRSRRIRLPGEPLVAGTTALRPWRDTDLDALVVACQDREIARWTRVPLNYGQTDARAYLLQRYDMIFAGMAAPFAIVGAPDAQLLGSISLMRIVWEHGRAEVGYWLARDARGQGHATRAVQLICSWGFAKLGAGANRPAGRHGKSPLPAGCRALRFHPRGRAAFLHAGYFRAPGHGRVRPAGR